MTASGRGIGTFRYGLCVAIAVLAYAVSAPRQAGASPPGVGGDVIDFAKWDLSITESTLTLYDDGAERVKRRSGSGDGNLDECVPNHGPLPDGQYDGDRPWHQDEFRGTKIFGRVVRLQNKACFNGQLRTDLFIHTEETPGRQQGTVENQRWDGNGDYKSQGCIKVSRSENGGDNGIEALDSWWHGVAGGGVGAAYYGVLNVWWL